MTTETAPRKYASALLRQFSTADADKAWTALAGLSAALIAVPALKIYLAHPQVARAEKEALLKQVLQMEKAPETVQRFVLLLLEQGQIASLPGITECFRAAVDAAQGVQAVEVRSTAALSAVQKKRLEAELVAKLKTATRLTFIEDPALLGGILVRTKDRVLDGSVQGRLNAMREKLLAD